MIGDGCGIKFYKLLITEQFCAGRSDGLTRAWRDLPLDTDLAENERLFREVKSSSVEGLAQSLA